MARRRRKKAGTHLKGARAACVGAVLLSLRNAIRRAERCRRDLIVLGYSHQRWREIVKDVDPELRFMARPKTLDAIVTYLRSAGEPVSRDALVSDLGLQAGGNLRHIRHSITANLTNRNLVPYPDNKIGLPEWKKTRRP